MTTPLDISNVILSLESDTGRVFDMTRRCAFAVWEEGDFDIKIHNDVYRVNDYCIITCMPFMNVEVVKIRKNSRILLGGIRLEDVLSVINPAINSSNLLDIQQRPVVKIDKRQFDYISLSIKGYLEELSEARPSLHDTP